MMELTLTSKQAARLVGASTSVAKSVELHSMVHENGMMKMREVKEIELPAGKRVNLGEAGFHLMLIGLKAPLKAGEIVPVTLTIQAGKEKPVKIEAQAEVRPLNEQKAEPKEAEHSHHHH
jgi:copper(I)-binding protein